MLLISLRILYAVMQIRTAGLVRQQIILIFSCRREIVFSTASTGRSSIWYAEVSGREVDDLPIADKIKTFLFNMFII